MERTRLLWVIAALTILVIVVVAGGVYLLRPQAAKTAQKAPVSATTLTAPDVDPYQWVRGTAPAAELSGGEASARDGLITVGEQPESGTSASTPPAAGAEGGAAPGAATTAPGAATAPTPPSPTVRVSPTPKEATPAPAPAPQPAAKPQVKAPAPATPTPPKSTPKPSATTSKPKAPAAAAPTAAAPAAKASPAPAKITEFWIQVASLRTVSTAEKLQGQMAEKGLSALITTSQQGSQTYYRVRLGPYPSRAEAERFLATVKTVPGLQESYISVVYTSSGR